MSPEISSGQAGSQGCAGNHGPLSEQLPLPRGPGWEQGEAGLLSQDLGEGGHLHPLARGDSRSEARGSRSEAGGSRYAPSRHPCPAFQAYLSVGQADDPLTPIQVLAAVACRKRGVR